MAERQGIEGAQADAPPEPDHAAVTTVINPAPVWDPDRTLPPVVREDTTVLSAAPIIWTPAAPAAEPLPEPLAPTPESTMPNHLIFDRFPTATVEEDEDPPAPARAAVYVPHLHPPRTLRNATSPYGPHQRPPGRPPQGPPPGYPPQQYPPQFPPGQRPPGQRPPGPRTPPPGYRPGPPTQPGGGGGPGGPGGPGGYGPGPGGFDDGSGSKRKMIVAIVVGAVVLIGAAIGIVLALRGGPDPGADPTPSTIVVPSASTSPASTPTTSESSTSAEPTADPTASPTPTSSASNEPLQDLPKASPLPLTLAVVPMRRTGGSDRSLYLVDTESKINRVKLPAEGRNSNPMMQASRDTIIYLSDGVLRVMASDGQGDRELFDRDPAGCDKVLHASWNLADPDLMVISCEVSKAKDSLLVIDLTGKLVRRLDVGLDIIGDFGLTPDGQTLVYWASNNPNLDGGAIFTLPTVGTGEPKRLTESADGVDSDPAWSPDATQIAFRRTVPNGTADGNRNVFVMNADGSGARAVATTPAADFKPIWSPDNENLLIISNRTSTFGPAGETYDLWLTRVSDGEVLAPLGLKARAVTRPFWTLR